MQVEIKIDENCCDPKIIIMTNQVNAEVNNLIQTLTAAQQTTIAGMKDDFVEILEPECIFRVYASDSKVFIETRRVTYHTRLRLYEAEQRLCNHSFARISNSEIINLKLVKRFDLSFSGTICVMLTNGTVTNVSRRYVSRIKQILGL